MEKDLELLRLSNETEWTLGDFIAKNLAMAFIYFFFSKLASYFSVPPGYATAIWPSAGIAVFALIYWGKQLWFGIFLGSALVNFLITTQNLTLIHSLTLFDFFLCVSIGLGAALQAYIGSILSQNLFKTESDYLSDKKIILNLLLIGVFCCFINSTLSVSLLLATGKINAQNYLESWLTWYSGDVMGVMVFTPACFILLTPIYCSNWNRKLFAILPLAIAFSAAIVAYSIVNSTEENEATAKFDSSANELVSRLNNKFQDYSNLLYSLKSFHYSSSDVDNEEFSNFSTTLMELSGSVFAIAWAPKVNQEDVSRFKTQMKKKHSQYEIIERNELGDFTSVANRNFYVPVVYVEPFDEGRNAALGFDLMSQMDRRMAILSSIEKGNIVTSSPVNLISDSDSKKSIMMFLPVFKGKFKSFEKFEGIYLAAIRMDDVFRIINPGLISQFDKLVFTDITDNYNPQALYNFEDESFKQSEIGVSWSQKVSFGERIYELQAFSTKNKLFKGLTWPVWMTLTFGMSLTGILSAFVLVIFGRSRQLEIEIEKNSYEIKIQREHAEQINRFKSLGIMAGGVAHEINNPLMIITGNATVLARILEKENVRNPRALESIGKINKTVERISRIVKGLLALSRDPSQDPFESQEFRKIVDYGMLLLSEKFKAYGVTLKQIGEIDLTLNCKVAQIAQVLTALLQNSLEAVRNLNNPWVEIQCLDKGNEVEIRITDSGTGLDLEVQEKIFTPFFTTKDVGEGTGLGLSISRGIVETHGGTLVFDPKSPHTRFIITLPKLQAKVLNFR